MMNQQVLTRLTQEYQLCTQDNDLIQIGCNFGLENNNIFKWRITMVGPRNTPYEGGLFTIIALFPPDYPNHGPEFKFLNKIYHLNVDFKNNLGHICINSINEWMITGKVRNKPCYTVKQAVDKRYLKAGDICIFKNRDHTFSYTGQGYLFFDGGHAAMKGNKYTGIIVNYNTNYYKDFKLSYILRWK